MYATPQSPTTKATAAAAGLADFVSTTLTRVQQDDVDARRAKEKASATAMERQQAYDAALARVAKAKEEAWPLPTLTTPQWRA
jgi:tryptophan 2,3-dioxygenase